MEEKFEEGVARGMDLGREEGYTVAKQGFDGIVKALKDREQSEKVSTSDFGTQTDSPHTTTTTSHLDTPAQASEESEPTLSPSQPQKSAQRLWTGQKTPTHFQSFLRHLHCFNCVIFCFCIHLHHLHFHLFNVAYKIVQKKLNSLIVAILILTPILLIHLIMSHLNPCNPILMPKNILNSTGNVTPAFLISAAPSRLWDGYVHLDTTVLICC